MKKSEKEKILFNYNVEKEMNEKNNRTELSVDDILEDSLLKEIQELGYDVQVFCQIAYINDARLVNIFKKYIHKFRQRNITELLIRYMGNKNYKNATAYCIDMYKKESPTPIDAKVLGLKWVWGLTLCNICDEAYADEYIKLIDADKFDRDGSQIILLLSKIKDERALPIILRYLDFEHLEDSAANNSIIPALGNYAKPELKRFIEPFIRSKDSYTKNLAKAALAKIERANKKKDG
jgi:hypothetical protein